MTELDEKLRAVGAMWGGADYERIAETLAPVHDRLVERLDARPGESWLDVATGTGALALRLAQVGVNVTGIDLSEPLLAQARAKAVADGLDVQWTLADAQALPFAAASFDGVVSSFGVIFAPDRAAVAHELARVCRPKGQLGLATWVPDPELGQVWAPFTDRPPSADIDFWGHEENVRELLAGDFDLEIEREDWRFEAESAEAAWELSCQAAPPVKALAESLSPERREEFRRAFLAFYERYATQDGIRGQRPFLLVLGRRR